MNSRNLRVEPAAPVGATAPIHAVRKTPELGEHTEPRPPVREPMAVVTGGQLRAAYAEYVVDPTTHHVVVRIRDAVTDQLLHETPSAELQAVQRSMAEYADAAARHHAAVHDSDGA